MANYIFYHYGPSDDASSFSFEELSSDNAAESEARRLLVFDRLRVVEICEGAREVGSVRTDPQLSTGAPA